MGDSTDRKPIGDDERATPEVVSVAMPGDRIPDLQQPVIISADENATALRIRDAIISDPTMGGADIVIQIHGSTAIISGTVLTEEQKDRVLDAASRVVGRDRIRDEVETGEQVSYVCEA